jgi:putative FmdB family regulatory protein
LATYDLACGSCGTQFDVFVQGFLKDEARVCPECGSREVEQRFTGFLRGSSGSHAVGAAPTGGPAGGCGCGCGH